jgi:hypothetical protein
MNIKSYLMNSKCPITEQNDNPFVYLDFGDFPLVNNLEDTKEKSLQCERYPLALQYHPSSGLTKLTHIVDGDKLFSNYHYKSGISQPYIDHCKQMFADLADVYDIEDDDLIVDVGGNDGTLLKTFKDQTTYNLRLMNVDPAGLEQVDDDIELNPNFFSKFVDGWKGIDINLHWKYPNLKPKIITSTNVFQHLEDINDFVKGVEFILHDDGVWVLEFPYWAESLDTLQFDQVYHEHVYYYFVTPLDKLFKKHGLKIINITEHKIHGGTLRLEIVHEESKLKPNDSIDYYLISEKDYDEEYLLDWGDEVAYFSSKVTIIIEELLSNGKTIAGFGAAAKGCIFLNKLGLTDKHIQYVVDDTESKQGKYIPGTGIEVVDREHLKNNPVDYILILPHNFRDHIASTLPDYKEEQLLTFLPL